MSCTLGHNLKEEGQFLVQASLRGSGKSDIVPGWEGHSTSWKVGRQSQVGTPQEDGSVYVRGKREFSKRAIVVAVRAEWHQLGQRDRGS